jgi:hypothetical protein
MIDGTGARDFLPRFMTMRWFFAKLNQWKLIAGTADVGD